MVTGYRDKGGRPRPCTTIPVSTPSCRLNSESYLPTRVQLRCWVWLLRSQAPTTSVPLLFTDREPSFRGGGGGLLAVLREGSKTHCTDCGCGDLSFKFFFWSWLRLLPALDLLRLLLSQMQMIHTGCLLFHPRFICALD